MWGELADSILSFQNYLYNSEVNDGVIINLNDESASFLKRQGLKWPVANKPTSDHRSEFI